MDKIITDKDLLQDTGKDAMINIQQIVENNRKACVTMVEANGSSVVLMNNSSEVGSSVGNSLQTGLNDGGNVISESVLKAGQGTIVKPQQPGLTISDVGFTSLLSKHLYSTTMTGASSQEPRPEVLKSQESSITINKNENQAASEPVVMLPPQNQINVVHPDLLRMGSLLNNQNLIVGNGQSLPQIIYVPIIAAPPVVQPSTEENSLNEANPSAAVLNPVAPLNYSMLSALPLSSSPNNLNNIVYVQPAPQLATAPVLNPAATPVLNPAAAPILNPAVAPLLNSIAAPVLNQAVAPVLNSAATPVLNTAMAPAMNPATVVLNSSIQQQQVLSAASTVNYEASSIPTSAAAALLNLVQSQSASLLNLAAAAASQQPQQAVPINFDTALQPQQQQLLNLALNQQQTNAAMPESATVNKTNTLKVATEAAMPVNTGMNVASTASVMDIKPKRGQKRKLSRNKSCSSDTSSLDSSMVDGLSSPSQGLVRQTSVTSKKIERVRKTVNTEEELNSKVSGLVSKILSQFPKTPPHQQSLSNKSRYPVKPSKRNKESADILPLTNSMIPSTVLLAEEESATENNLSNDETESLPKHVTNLNRLQDQYLNQSVSRSIAATNPLQTVSAGNHVITAPLTTQNTSLILEKPLVSRIELSSILTGDDIAAEASNSNEPQVALSGPVVETSIPNHLQQTAAIPNSSKVLGVSAAVLSDSGIIIQTHQPDQAVIVRSAGNADFVDNATIMVQSAGSIEQALNAAMVVQQSGSGDQTVIVRTSEGLCDNRAVIVESAPGQVPLEYVQIAGGRISNNAQQSFTIEEISQ